MISPKAEIQLVRFSKDEEYREDFRLENGLSLLALEKNRLSQIPELYHIQELIPKDAAPKSDLNDREKAVLEPLEKNMFVMECQ